MNTYEVLVIFKPIVDVDSVDSTLKQFENNIIQAHKGEIVEADRIGRKRLAYDIKKFKDGFLTVYLLKLSSAKVADFMKACQYSEDILRVTLVRKDRFNPTNRRLPQQGEHQHQQHHHHHHGGRQAVG